MTPSDKKSMYSVIWMTPHSRMKHISHFRARERELHSMRVHCGTGERDLEVEIENRIEACRRTADLIGLATNMSQTPPNHH